MILLLLTEVNGISLFTVTITRMVILVTEIISFTDVMDRLLKITTMTMAAVLITVLVLYTNNVVNIVLVIRSLLAFTMVTRPAVTVCAMVHWAIVSMVPTLALITVTVVTLLRTVTVVTTTRITTATECSEHVSTGLANSCRRQYMSILLTNTGIKSDS